MKTLRVIQFNFGILEVLLFLLLSQILKNLTKSYAIDFTNCGIRINNLSPGYTRTKMTKKSWNNKKKRLQRTNKTTLLRWGNPEDYNEAVDFLIDSKKSGYMTGSDLIIDGGWTIKGM